MSESQEATLRVVSSDSHVVEPYDLWTTRLAETPYADRAPHMTGDAEGGYVFHIDGLPPFPVGLAGAAGRPSDTLGPDGEMRRLLRARDSPRYSGLGASSRFA